MSWWKKLLGIKSEEEKLLVEIDRLQKLAFAAQRKGDLSLSGKYQMQVEAIYDQIEDSRARQDKK